MKGIKGRSGTHGSRVSILDKEVSARVPYLINAQCKLKREL